MVERMPALFVGHGSPMNAVEDNAYSLSWAEIGEKLKKPVAILSISAHWYTQGTRITDSARPEIVYDMYGFPEELYEIRYQPPGSPELAHTDKDLISSSVIIDNTWGIDHGTWSVLHRMFPDADIPVFQLSVNASTDAEALFRIGTEIRALREKGVMIFGSGNIVHNLSRVNWLMAGGYPWAWEFDAYIMENVVSRHFENVIDYRKSGTAAMSAFNTPDHFYPLLYILGSTYDDDKTTVFNNSCTLGALSMTSFLFE